MRVADATALEQALISRGCILGAPIRQEDVIYGRPDNNIYEKSKGGQIAVRIRSSDNKFLFNLKKNLSNELDNIEHELEIMDKEEMHAMLGLMGWQPVVEVKKIRRKGKLGEYEICLDEVDGLGSYAELEKMTGDDADAALIQEKLLSEFEKLGVPKSAKEINGYDTLMYRKKHGKNEKNN